MLDDKKKFKQYSSDKVWIKGSDCTNLQIDGGKYYGHSHAWPKLHSKNDDRPRMFQFSGMTGLEMRNTELLDSAAGHIHISNSVHVTIHSVNLSTEVQDNSDGITLVDTKHATVTDATVHNADDSLKLAGKCSDVLFSGCHLSGGHGLSLGGGSDILEVEDVKFYDIHLLGMSDGARLKITPETQGFAKNITWQKLRMTNVRTPIIVQTDYDAQHHSHSKSFKFGDLYYIDIKAGYDSKQFQGSGKFSAADPHETEAAGVFSCDDSAPCKKLHLTDITIDTNAQWICNQGKGSMTNVFPKVFQHNCVSAFFDSDFVAV